MSRRRRGRGIGLAAEVAAEIRLLRAILVRGADTARRQERSWPRRRTRNEGRTPAGSSRSFCSPTARTIPAVT
jgi:hypothetical protein